MNKIFSAVVALMLFISFSEFAVHAESPKQVPQELLAKKYPNEVIRIIKTVDLNNDNKKESFIVTDSGNFFYINSKGVLVFIEKSVGYEEDEFNLSFFAVTAKEKQVALTVDYLPSNTLLYVYRLQDGTLTKKLQVMGDVGIEIDTKGRIHQYWKNFNLDSGWDQAEGIFTWNPKTNKYKPSGKYVLQK